VSFNLGSAIFRRSVFDKVGRFDTSQIHSEDVDWFMHARELGVQMVVIEAVTLLYRKHDSNLTRDREANLKGFMQAVRKSIQRRQQAGKSAENLPQLQYLQKNGEITRKNPEIVTPLATATHHQPPINPS
jgi:GT2 family glycosyltransferase